MMTVRFIEGAGGSSRSGGPSGGRRGRTAAGGGNIFQRAGRAIRRTLGRRGRAA